MLVDQSLVEGLKFDEESHVYTYEGEVYAGVTETLQFFGFGGKSFENVPEWALEMGRMRHLTTQLYDENALDMDTLDPKLVPALDAWKLWRSDNPEIEFHSIECRVADHGTKTAGTIDRIVKVGDEFWVVDIKGQTSSPSYQLQLQAYAWMARNYVGTVEEPAQFSRLLSVHLLKNGKYKEKEYEPCLSDWLNIAHAYRLVREGAYGRK